MDGYRDHRDDLFSIAMGAERWTRPVAVDDVAQAGDNDQALPRVPIPPTSQN